MKQETHQSWGRFPGARHAAVERIYWPNDPLPSLEQGRKVLAYGCGRSYGDVCLNDGGCLIETRGLDRFISFDAERGLLSAEAGVTLAEILQLIVPKGWFLPVVPGTKHVTLGGAIANDVHGKNHHTAGTFGRFVNRLELRRSNGQSLTCSAFENEGLYSATVGGIGLTGLIVSAEISLVPVRSASVDVEEVRFDELDDFFVLTEASDRNFDHTVAWIDGHATGRSLGRGIFTRGNHAGTGPLSAGNRKSRKLPLDAPGRLLSSPLLKVLNRLYYHRRSRSKKGYRSHYEPFFFPLDSIGNWNRLYGKRGLIQYQFVVPDEVGPGVVRQVLLNCIDAKFPPNLAVLKRFGAAESPGLLSFPRKGVTLALDFPAGSGRLLHLLTELDEIVMGNGGALYPAKDARMAPEVFRRSFPRLADFCQYIDPAFSSSFWRRMKPEEDA